MFSMDTFIILEIYFLKQCKPIGHHAYFRKNVMIVSDFKIETMFCCKYHRNQMFIADLKDTALLLKNTLSDWSKS